MSSVLKPQQPIINTGGGPLPPPEVSVVKVQNQPAPAQPQSQPVELSSGIYPTPVQTQQVQAIGAPPELINASEQQNAAVIDTGGRYQPKQVAVVKKPSLQEEVYNALFQNPLVKLTDEFASALFFNAAYPRSSRYYTTSSGVAVGGGGRGYTGMAKGQQLTQHTTGTDVASLVEQAQQQTSSLQQDIQQFNAKAQEFNQEVTGLSNALKIDPNNPTLNAIAREKLQEYNLLSSEQQQLKSRAEGLANLQQNITEYEKSHPELVPASLSAGFIAGLAYAIDPATWPAGILSIANAIKNPAQTWQGITATPETEAYFVGQIAGSIAASKIPVSSYAEKLTLEAIEIGPERMQGIFDFRLAEPEGLAMRAEVTSQKIAPWQAEELEAYRQQAEAQAYGLRVVTEGGEARTLMGIPTSSFEKLFKGEEVPITSQDYRYYFRESNVAKPRYIEQTRMEPNPLEPPGEVELVEKDALVGSRAVSVNYTIENPYTDWGIGLSEAKEQYPSEETTLNPGKLTTYTKESFSLQKFRAQVLGYELGKEEQGKLFGTQGKGNKLPFFSRTPEAMEKAKSQMVKDLEESMKPEEWQSEFEAREFEKSVKRLSSTAGAKVKAKAEAEANEEGMLIAGKGQTADEFKPISSGRQQTLLLQMAKQEVKPAVRVEYRTRSLGVPATKVKVRSKQRLASLQTVKFGQDLKQSTSFKVANRGTLKHASLSAVSASSSGQTTFNPVPTPPQLTRFAPSITPYWLPTASPKKHGRRGTKYWEELYSLYDLRKMFGR